MVRVQIADHIALITMDNPPVNAQNAACRKSTSG
jgi:enoyl-CoA hydratase